MILFLVLFRGCTLFESFSFEDSSDLLDKSEDLSSDSSPRIFEINSAFLSDSIFESPNEDAITFKSDMLLLSKVFLSINYMNKSKGIKS